MAAEGDAPAGAESPAGVATVPPVQSGLPAVLEDGLKITEPESEEERMKYLRARGVEIVMPKGRDVPDSAGPTRPVRVVRIPAADNEDVSEIVVPVPAEEPGDALKDALAPRFAGGKASKEKLEAQIASVQQAVSLSTVQSLVEAGGVETFRLAAPTKENGWESVYLYLDECGALKELSPNRRAAELAARCGFPGEIDLRGDMYLGRQLNTPTGLRVVDFPFADFQPGCLWQRRAPSENLQTQQDTRPEEHARAQETALAAADPSAERSGDGYRWRDDGDDVEVLVTLAAGATKKDVSVKILAGKVVVKGPGAELDLSLSGQICPDDSSWSLGDGTLVLTLAKATAKPWSELLKSK